DFIAGLIGIARVDNGDGTARYDVTANTAPLKTYFDALAPNLLIAPVNARFHYDESSNQLVLLQDSTDGCSRDVTTTRESDQDALFRTDGRQIALKFDKQIAKVNGKSTAQQLGITEKIVDSTTFFYGSTPDRRVNIQVAASKFDGIVIAPGQLFSFGDYL